ncbi:phosphopantetheine-binding protein [Nocardia brasiliensis]|uniref:Putative acyl-carrier protein n=1 Tax=Nocardia brasiliensis TaxID=37326 RepID=A0A060PWL5_NOCBR|nr:phosphopantetheine-binding protein [Nocardia brasiliensis]BAO99138.1 putative acyl-carrier protein [Nocardia brasiliensis]
MARLTALLEDAMGVEISLATIYDHPDIDRLVEYLAMR